MFLYDSQPQLHFSLRAHYSGRCPIVLSLQAFSWAYQKHNTKICREEEEGAEGAGGGGGLSQSEGDAEASNEERDLC